MEGYDILIYVYEPSGYGTWCGPTAYTNELHPEIEKYIVNGDEQKGKQKYILTDFYTHAYKKQKARLYVPLGTTAEESGLSLIPVLKLVSGL